MEHLIISELERTVNPFTGYTKILIRVSAKPPHQIQICTGNSQYVITSSITFTLIQKERQNPRNH